MKDVHILNRSECIENVIGRSSSPKVESARRLQQNGSRRSLLFTDDRAGGSAFSEGVSADFFKAVDANSDGTIDFGECAYSLDEATGLSPTTTATKTTTITTKTITITTATSTTVTASTNTAQTSISATVTETTATMTSSSGTATFPLSTRPAQAKNQTPLPSARSWKSDGVVAVSANGSGAIALGPAGDLGLCGGSFSVALELWRDAAQKDSPDAAYTILGAPEDDSFEAVLWNGSLGASFLGTRCSSRVAVPKERWVDVIFLYDAGKQELHIFQEGKPVHNCSRMDPFEGKTTAIWLGRSAPDDKAGVAPWRGAFRSVEISEGLPTPVGRAGGAGPSPAGAALGEPAASEPPEGAEDTVVPLPSAHVGPSTSEPPEGTVASRDLTTVGPSTSEPPRGTVMSRPSATVGPSTSEPPKGTVVSRDFTTVGPSTSEPPTSRTSTSSAVLTPSTKHLQATVGPTSAQSSSSSSERSSSSSSASTTASTAATKATATTMAKTTAETKAQTTTTTMATTKASTVATIKAQTETTIATTTAPTEATTAEATRPTTAAVETSKAPTEATTESTTAMTKATTAATTAEVTQPTTAAIESSRPVEVAAASTSVAEAPSQPASSATTSSTPLTLSVPAPAETPPAPSGPAMPPPWPVEAEASTSRAASTTTSATTTATVPVMNLAPDTKPSSGWGSSVG
ncbi:unnamed protein product, partial [Prorocentrum cordatum]